MKYSKNFLMLALSLLVFVPCMGMERIRETMQSAWAALSGAAKEPHELSAAINSGDIRSVKSLFKSYSFLIENEMWPEGVRPLVLASRIGRLDIVKYLILHCRADIEARTEDGKTALAVASEANHPDIVNFLFNMGADREARDRRGYTPLALAAEQGHGETVRCLFLCGANIEARTKEGDTPLTLAVTHNRIGIIDVVRYDLVRYFLARGADIEAQNRDGNTSLGITAIKGDILFFLVLVGEGANIEARNLRGSTPLALASEFGHKDMVFELLERGANLQARDIRDCKPLDLAASQGHGDIVSYLIKFGDVKPLVSRFEYDTAEPLINPALVEWVLFKQPKVGQLPKEIEEIIIFRLLGGIQSPVNAARLLAWNVERLNDLAFARLIHILPRTVFNKATRHLSIIKRQLFSEKMHNVIQHYGYQAEYPSNATLQNGLARLLMEHIIQVMKQIKSIDTGNIQNPEILRILALNFKELSEKFGKKTLNVLYRQYTGVDFPAEVDMPAIIKQAQDLYTANQ